MARLRFLRQRAGIVALGATLALAGMLVPMAGPHPALAASDVDPAGLAGSYYYPYSANPSTRIDSLQIFWDRVCLRLNPFACTHRYTVQPFSSTYHWEARQTGFTAGTSPTIRVVYTNVCALPPQLCLALHSTTLTITRTPSGVHVDIDTRSQFSSSHTGEDLIPTWEVG